MTDRFPLVLLCWTDCDSAAAVRGDANSSRRPLLGARDDLAAVIAVNSTRSRRRRTTVMISRHILGRIHHGARIRDVVMSWQRLRTALWSRLHRPALSASGAIPPGPHFATAGYTPSCLKKSLPLSSTRMNAGKSTTSIFQTASMPSSGKSMHSTFVMFSSASSAAGPPMEPR
jgi:hypothetical protein